MLLPGLAAKGFKHHRLKPEYAGVLNDLLDRRAGHRLQQSQIIYRLQAGKSGVFFNYIGEERHDLYSKPLKGPPRTIVSVSRRPVRDKLAICGLYSHCGKEIFLL